VERYLGNAGSQGPLGDEFADLGGGGHVAAVHAAGAKVLLHRGGGGDHGAVVSGDDLRIDMTRRAMNAQARRTEALDMRPGLAPTTLTCSFLVHRGSQFFFASFLTICSPL